MTMPAPAVADAQTYPRSGYAWYAVVVLVATTVLSYTDRQILTLLVGSLHADLHITDTQFGVLVGTAFAVLYGLAGLPFGYLADRRSRRNLILGGVFLWSAGTIACAAAPSFWALFAGRMVVGIGEAALTPAAISLISDYFPPQRRGTATGVFLMGIAMGAGGAILFGGLVLRFVESGFLAGTVLRDVSSWRLVLLVLGSLGAVPIALLLTVAEPMRRKSWHAQPAVSRPVVRWGPLMPLLLGVALISLVDNAVLAWTPSILILQFGVPAADVGVLLGGLLMLGGSIGVLSGGVLGDRARNQGGRTAQLRLCLAAACVTAPLSVLVLGVTAKAIYVSVVLYILCSGIGTAAGIAALLDGVGNDQRGIVTAVSFFLNVALGAGVGPPAVALIKEHVLGPGAGLPAAIALVWAGGFALVGVAFYAGLRLLRGSGAAPA